MLIRPPRPWQLPENQVTPRSAFLNRRQIMAAGSAAALTGLVGCGNGASEALPSETASGAQTQAASPPAATQGLTYSQTGYAVEDALTPLDAVSGYNNFYEFGVGKDEPARHAHRMSVDPWSVTVDGHAARTGTFALEDVIDMSALEERIYRLRCVEAWSMVIPWIGVPLASVLRRFEPTSDARFVAFETYLDRQEMRGTRFPVLDWPYVEGLRMDEAMNELAFLAVGLYGDVLPNQNGAPVRLVVPWKYGYKSIKSITRISFVSEQPPTSWNIAAPHEYGFYSNVNPNRAHPRWSQRTERVIGGGVFSRRDTEMFNGYADQVAHLYAGMDLIENH